ncbi:MAG: hypothetical protein M3Y49_21245 [Actinomycetota bacterium]|nr:hypothetical protein [Actinomycetota bacterium]
MSSEPASSTVSELITDVVAHATGRRERTNPVAARTGGPAGNALLTAWTGLVLLVLFLAELVTLLDVRGLITWHVVLGALLIPPALLKTATTSWRIVRYYSGNADYRTAGPPPTLLRLLGPLVVASTLAVLGTGVALIVIGESGSRTALATVAGFRLDWLTLHQGSFIVWGIATGLHVLARTVPAVREVAARSGNGSPTPGPGLRAVVMTLTVAVAAATATLLVYADGSWQHLTRHLGH